MSVRSMPAGLRFGLEVIVQATAERLVTSHDDKAGPGFQQLVRSRGYIGKKAFRYTGTTWPGAPVDLDWDAAPRSYPLAPRFPEPPPEPAVVRIRRMLHEHPPKGVVIGVTDRLECLLADGDILGPTRLVTLVEIALTVRSGPSKVILAHPRDIQPIPRPRRAP